MNMKEARRRHRLARKTGTTDESFKRWARKALRKQAVGGKLAHIVARR